jgi:hypothetical protein
VGLESNNRMNGTRNSPVYYPIGIASDYRLNRFFSFRGSVQARWFTDVPNEVSFGSIVESYALSFERNYNQYFLTLGPVFHWGRQWQWCISPQVGLKMAFLKHNAFSELQLAQIRTYEPDYGFVYGLSNHLWYQWNEHWQCGIGIEAFGHQAQQIIRKIETVGRDISDNRIQQYINESMDNYAFKSMSLNLGVKYQF